MRHIAVCHFVAEDDPAYEKSRSRKDGYEYLLPESYSADSEVPGYAVVCAPDRMNLVDFKVVKIRAVREMTEQQYEGNLKQVVAVFSTDEYVAAKEKLAKKAALLVQIEKKVAERSKVKALEDIAGSDPEARALLEAFKAL